MRYVISTGSIKEPNKSRILELLVGGIDVCFCEDDAKITPLHHAAASANLDIIFLLMQYGASAKALSNTGETPLDIACELNRFDVISLISNWNKSRKVH